MSVNPRKWSLKAQRISIEYLCKGFKCFYINTKFRFNPLKANVLLVDGTHYFIYYIYIFTYYLHIFCGHCILLIIIKIKYIAWQDNFSLVMHQYFHFLFWFLTIYYNIDRHLIVWPSSNYRYRLLHVVLDISKRLNKRCNAMNKGNSSMFLL